MQELYGYKSSDYFKDTTCESRKHEDEELPKLINELKDVEKKNNK